MSWEQMDTLARQVVRAIAAVKSQGKARTMKYDIRNRWTGDVQFSAEIECSDDAPVGFKVGLAVRWAISSGAVLRGADLRDAYLRDAVLRGADLSGANLRGADLSGAKLSGAVLRDAVLSGANLRDADLRGADLSGAVLSGAVLSGADLSGAVLSDGLEGVPKIRDIHKAVYAAASQPGALNMSNWHTCGTTHCRAGWVITLAGEGGRALEWAVGTPAAAAIIYIASDPNLERVPDFYCDNATALADMKRLAKAETQVV